MIYIARFCGGRFVTSSKKAVWREGMVQGKNKTMFDIAIVKMIKEAPQIKTLTSIHPGKPIEKAAARRC
jgi:hypothetical protein